MTTRAQRPKRLGVMCPIAQGRRHVLNNLFLAPTLDGDARAALTINVHRRSADIQTHHRDTALKRLENHEPARLMQTREHQSMTALVQSVEFVLFNPVNPSHRRCDAKLLSQRSQRRLLTPFTGESDPWCSRGARHRTQSKAHPFPMDCAPRRGAAHPLHWAAQAAAVWGCQRQ